MRRNNIITFVLLIFIVSSIVLPEVVSNSIKKEKNTNETEIKGAKLVYIGEMVVNGTGNHETSEVNASSVKNLKINVGHQGSDILLEARYDLYCPGLLDSAYAKLWVNSGQEKEIDTDDEAEGFFYILIEDCKIGDLIYWTLTVIYDDLLFPYPLYDFDDGSAFCRIYASNNKFLDFVKQKITIIGKIICK